MTMEALDEKVISNLNHYLFYEDAIKYAVGIARLEQGASRGGTAGGSGHAFISDPTALLAMKHTAPLKSIKIVNQAHEEETICNPEAWLRVMDRLYKLYEHQMAGKCMRQRYIKHERPMRIMIRMGISQRTYYYWKDEFIRDFAMLAIQEKLIEPRSIVKR